MNHHPSVRSRPFLTTSVAVLLFVVLGLTGARGADEVANYVVLISIDGLKPEAYTAPGGTGMPTLRRLASRGTFASGVVGVFPTVTYPSHTTLITGVLPAVHGIYNNRVFDPEGRLAGAGSGYWYSRDIAVPTLPGVLRARGLKTAAVNWPVAVGLDADFVVPDYPVSSRPEGLAELRALSKPSTLLTDVESGLGHSLPWPMTDDGRVEIASWILRERHPHFLMVHLADTDSTQHYYGPGSPEALAAIATADRQVARLVDVVDRIGLASRTNIVVVSDHGFSPTTQRVDLNTLFRQEGWIRFDDRGRVVGWDVYFQPLGGSGFVFLANRDDLALKARVRTLLDWVASDPANGVQRVFSEEELRTAGADPRASFAVDVRSGFFAGGNSETLVSTAGARGGHGSDPTRPDMYASLVMAGPDVLRAGDEGLIRMTQIGPTIASWFNVHLSPLADKPLDLSKRR